MGFRFRKSINLGGGFRVNLSKSGIGYSFGTKGARITKTTRGTRRTTIGIPGTGISYSAETKKSSAKQRSQKKGRCSSMNATNHRNNSASHAQKKSSKTSSRKKWMWVFTIFFALGFFAFFPSFASFFSLMTAALLAPIRKWQRIIRRHVRGWLRTVLIIILVLLTFLTSLTTDSTDNSLPANPTPDAINALTSESTPLPTIEATIEPTIEPTAEPTAKPTPEPTTRPTPKPTENAERDYVVNINTEKIHYPNCRSVSDIKSENKREYHGTIDALINRGYEPCGICKPR